MRWDWNWKATEVNRHYRRHQTTRVQQAGRWEVPPQSRWGQVMRQHWQAAEWLSYDRVVPPCAMLSDVFIPAQHNTTALTIPTLQVPHSSHLQHIKDKNLMKITVRTLQSTDQLFLAYLYFVVLAAAVWCLDHIKLKTWLFRKSFLDIIFWYWLHLDF